MTVEAAEKMWSRDNLAFSSSDGRNRKATVREAWSVVAEPEDTSDEILTAEGLPQLTDKFLDYPQIRVVELVPNRISPVYWIVDVRYEGEAGPQGFASGGDADPVNTPPTIEWKNITIEEEIDTAFDEDDNVVSLATANGEPVIGVTETYVDFVAVIERNYSFGAFQLPQLHQYLRSVNNDEIVTNLGTFAPGLARLMRFEPKEAYSEENDGFIKVLAEVHFRFPFNTSAERAWWKRYLHEGYVLRVRDDGAPADGSEDRFVNVMDGNKDRSISPLHLDEEGFGIPDPSDPATPAFYREQRTLLRLPYSVLGLF